MNLLTRDEFRTATLARNNGQCVTSGCSLEATDAHHILNRNLFTAEDEFGGYFLENGAGLCAGHHLQAELTLISCADLYKACTIAVPALPAGFDATLAYDTWGNVVVSPFERKPGPLFEDSGCQKVLKKQGLLWQFSQHR